MAGTHVVVRPHTVRFALHKSKPVKITEYHLHTRSNLDSSFKCFFFAWITLCKMAPTQFYVYSNVFTATQCSYFWKNDWFEIV